MVTECEESREVERLRSKLKDIIKSGTSVCLEIGSNIEEAISRALSGRENVVMVRVNNETLKQLDALVEAGLFRTRSESAAFLLHAGIKANQELFAQIDQTVEKIRVLKDELRRLATGKES